MNIKTVEQLFARAEFKKFTCKKIEDINSEAKAFICKIIDEGLLSKCRHIRVVGGLIEYFTDGYYDRYLKILAIKNPKANSLENYCLRYGCDIGKKKYDEKNISSTVTLEKMVKMYGEEEGTKRFNEKVRSCTQSLKNMIKRYGEEEGRIRWGKFCEHNKGNLTVERQVEMYGIEEGNERFERIKKKLGTGINYYKRIYGDTEEAIEKHREKIKMLNHSSSEEGYKERFGSEYASVMRERKGVCSKDGFVKRHGEEVGRIEYERHCKRMSRMVSIDGFVERYGAEEGIKKRKEWIKKATKNNFGGWSMVSQELFWKIFEKINQDYTKIYFATNDNGKRNNKKNEEYVVQSGFKVYRIDFYIPEANCCIEFDGTYWHSVKYQHLWEGRDDGIKKVLEGVRILHIMESEYTKDKEAAVEKCIGFIKER